MGMQMVGRCRVDRTERMKRMILALSADEYQLLAEVAATEVREPEQQAVFFVRRALESQKAAVPA